MDMFKQQRDKLELQMSTIQDQAQLIEDLKTQCDRAHDESVGLKALNKFLEDKWLHAQKEVKELLIKLGMNIRDSVPGQKDKTGEGGLRSSVEK
ncbi:uncharacterized protein N7503_004541 [Penicillium pulvis]|uniref:uncharacterized protein n=1 Tax=Penicillium pulvis TaxID=1562058 RepID=UPI0025477D02|nr:uncharacterized protein N7503_004541 [Penicillium pulvis]KAJ5802091.1 hypothetical protein N7503_004541 [Penicillium pulvis]